MRISTSQKPSDSSQIHQFLKGTKFTSPPLFDGKRQDQQTALSTKAEKKTTEVQI